MNEQLDLENLELIMYDIEGTLILEEELKSPTGIAVVRGNCLQHLTQKPTIRINEGLKKLLVEAKEAEILQGILSGYAYQFGINYLSACEAREFIDPRLIFLAHKYAWEGMVLEGQDYGEVLKQYDKPAQKMYELARKTATEIKGKEITPMSCLYIGDSSTDKEGADNAGWNYLDITELEKRL